MAQQVRDKNQEIFETMPIPRALFTLAIPTIIGQLIILIYNMADTFFIGRTGNPLMVAGVSLILPVFNICVSLAGLVGVGGGTLISRLLGAQRRHEAGKVSSFCFWLCILIAAAFSVVMLLFMNPVLRLLGASDQIIGFARQYAFLVIVIGGIPTVLSMTMGNLLRSVGCAREAGFGVSMGGVINIFLDPLFMFVLLPKGYEIVGAGMATALSNVISCGYFLTMILRLTRKGGSGSGEAQVSSTAASLSLSPRAGLPDADLIRQIFFVGVPAAIATFLFDLAYIVIDKLTSNYGDIPLAAIGIVLKVERLPLNVGIGLCQGMMPIAAYNYSAKNFPRMRKVVNFSRLAGITFGAVAVALYEIFAPQIMSAFIGDPETIRIGTDFLRARCLATPFMFMCFHLVNMFQAVGRGDRALLLAVVRWAVFNIPMLFLFDRIFGMYGIVWTQISADICTVIVSFLVYRHFEKTVLQPQEKGL